MHSLDINAFISTIAGGAAVYAAIKVDIALLKYKYVELKRRFDAHEKKAGH